MSNLCIILYSLTCQHRSLQRLTETKSLAGLNFRRLSSYKVLQNLLLLIFKPSFSSLFQALTVMLHGTIRSDDFQRNTALQHCCDVVSNSCNIATQCRAKSRRCESSRVASPLDSSSLRTQQALASNGRKKERGARERHAMGEGVSLACPVLSCAHYFQAPDCYAG